MAVPTEWVEYTKSLGFPAIFGVAAYYILPKVWAYIQQRGAISDQRNGLEKSGIGGVNDVVTVLRGQIADYKTDLGDLRTRLTAMEALLQSAVDGKLSAEQGEAIAKNDLFNATLYIKKLIAQIKSLGATPVDE